MSDVQGQATAPGYGVDLKYGKVYAEKKEFHPDEPVFILRAQDLFAAAAIDDYAERCANAGCSLSHCKEAAVAAAEFRDWQLKNKNLVKRPG